MSTQVMVEVMVSSLIEMRRAPKEAHGREFRVNIGAKKKRAIRHKETAYKSMNSGRELHGRREVREQN